MRLADPNMNANMNVGGVVAAVEELLISALDLLVFVVEVVVRIVGEEFGKKPPPRALEVVLSKGFIYRHVSVGVI